MNILLVSGGPSLTRQVTAALPADAEVLEVRTPQRGLAVLDDGDQTFDVILGDADTHPTGGFYLAREIRARQTDGRAVPPVVLMISRPQDEYLCRWSQADAWIVKPVDAFDVAEVLAALVSGEPVPALPGVGVLGHAPQLGPGGGTTADRTVVGGGRHQPPLPPGSAAIGERPALRAPAATGTEDATAASEHADGAEDDDADDEHGPLQATGSEHGE